MPSVFTVHELLAVSCRLVLPATPDSNPLPVQSQKLNSPFVQKFSGPAEENNLQGLSDRPDRQTDWSGLFCLLFFGASLCN